MWPMLLDTPKEECKRILRRLELEAYGCLVSALRGQGELNKSKRQLLHDASNALHISTERHRAEVRRAVNDEKLATVAERLAGPNTDMDWAIEGRRLVPLMPRLAPQTAFTALANNVANLTAAENAKLPPPQKTAQSPEVGELEEPAAPESSRTPQGASVTPTGPQSYQIKSEENESRKRRRSSLEVQGQPLSPTLPPPKVAALSTPTSSLPPPSPRTVTIPVNMTPVKLSIATTPVRSTATTSSPTTTQKVIIMSSASNVPVGSPSLLQRSLSVPMVKTTMATITSTSSISSSMVQNKVTPTQVTGVTTGFIATAPGSAPRIRPKVTTTTATPVMPRGRAGSIVIPLTPNPTTIPPTGLQLKPVATSGKPTLHIKQDGSGMKIIAGAPKLMPKPPTVVATTSGTTRVVTLTATPRVSAVTATAGSSSTLTAVPQNIQSTVTSSTATLVGAKPLTQIGVSNSTLSSQGKANVIVVKKGTGFPAGQGMTLASGGRELLGKVLLRAPQSTTTGAGQKNTPQTASGLAQALNIQGGTRQGNVIVVDLSQEQLKGNTVLSEILQASGILTSANMTSANITQSEKKSTSVVEDEDSNDEPPQSPSSSTDTGSSLELNQSGVMSYEEPVKVFNPLPVAQLPTETTSIPHRSIMKIVTTTQSQRPGTYKLVTLNDDKRLGVASKQCIKIDAPDMLKIEKEMMSLGEGIQQEPEASKSVEVAAKSSDKNEDDQESMDVDDSLENESSEQVEEMNSSLDEVKEDKITTEESSQESQSILERSLTSGVEAYQRVVREACQEESSMSLDESKDKPELNESASQESQVSDQTEEMLGELDPQTGIFCLGPALQDESLSSSTSASRPMDIYSAAISSANITFDSNSETEPEIPEPITAPLPAMDSNFCIIDDEEEEISLVYNDDEDDDVIEISNDKKEEKVVESQQVKESSPSPSEQPSESPKKWLEVLNPTSEDLLDEHLEELEKAILPKVSEKDETKEEMETEEKKEETEESKGENEDIASVKATTTSLDSSDVKGETTSESEVKEAN